MPIARGTRLGPYEIGETLGAGGMGDVYRARDSRLDRSVAIKIVRGEFSERFEREARAISALNHPHICTLHDIGTEEGIHYLVMELVEGETLADRLRKGALPVDHAVRIASEIAVALEEAHRKGIAHRDLKPGNVMLTKTGVKLLDFGLAKTALAAPVSEAGATLSMASPITARNTVLGTPQYMAPEQVEGRETDTRADIFSFGCVLYQMLSGERPFDGKSSTSVMAAILERDPAPLAPPVARFDWLVRRCLEKDPDARFQSIHDVRLELDRVPEPAIAPRHGSRREIFAWTAAGLCLAALAAGAWWSLRAPVPAFEPPLTRLTSDAGVSGQPDITADGKMIVYASDRDGQKNFDLYVQQLPNGRPVRITNTDEDETDPVFSPDGTSIAFASSKGAGGIYIMPALGGEPRLVVRGGHSPKFSPDGNTIAYWTGTNTSGDQFSEGNARAFLVSASGGAPRQIHPEFTVVRNPLWSPDGRNLMFEGVAPGKGPVRDRADIWVAPVEGGTPQSTGLIPRFVRVFPAAGFELTCWTRDGLILAVRSTPSLINLYRFPIDPNGRSSGDPVQLTNGTVINQYPAVSHTGRLVFQSGTQRVNIWALPLNANSGKPTGAPYRVTDDVAYPLVPCLSEDGSKLLYGSVRNGPAQVWEHDMVTGKESLRINAAEGASSGIFLRSSGRIAFRKARAGYIYDPGTGEAVKITDVGFLMDADRKEQIGLVRPPTKDLATMGIIDLKSGRYSLLLRAEHWNIYQAHFSPDDRWIAFLANIGPSVGRIFVARPKGIEQIPQMEWLPITDEKDKVDKPRFSPDGKLIYYTLDGNGTRSIQAVRFDPDKGRPIGDPFLVYDFRGPRLSMVPVGLGALEISIGRDKMVMMAAESNFNIWMAELAARPKSQAAAK